MAWNTASTALLAAATELIADPTRLAGVTTIGVDEHVWRHTRFGDKYVTVVIDLTPARTNTGPARLLAVLQGRSKKAFKTWLEEQSEQFRDRVKVVAMDGFTGYKTAAVETIDNVTTVMDPFHVVAWLGTNSTNAANVCNRPPWATVAAAVILCSASAAPPTPEPACSPTSNGTDFWPCSTTPPTPRSRLPGTSTKTSLMPTTPLGQTKQKAYEPPHRHPQSKVPDGLEELRTLGRTLHRRREDILAYFDHPGTSNGPTEAINGLLEHLRGTARGFRNLTHDIARSLLDAGGFRPRIHSLYEERK